MNIVAFADHTDLLLETIAGARAAAGDGKVHAVLLGGDANKAIQHGADIAHVLKAPDQHPMTLAKAVAAIAKEADAQAIVVGATKRGKAFAGLLAGLFDAAYAAEVSSFGFDGGKPTATRMLLSGNTNGSFVYDAERLVVTAGPKTWEALPADSGRSGETREHAADAASKVTLVTVHEKKGAEVNLAQAKIVVGAGRGFKKQEDLKLATGLAEVLGGALGCSRPLAADLKWLGEEHWIGLSGNEIKPRLYVACGISGQIQHITGCRGAKTIVAINQDEDAPIFEHADYGIVGDVYDVLPKLTDLLKAKVTS